MINDYLLNTPVPLTVILIGCGGNGSWMLDYLSRLNLMLNQVGHSGLHVTVYDEDIVESHNVGKQRFILPDVGRNKATVSVTKYNRAYGFNWAAVPKHYDPVTFHEGNLMITCVDDNIVRGQVKQQLDASCLGRRPIAPDTPLYWLDLGNKRDKGQGILGSVQDDYLPDVIDVHPEMAHPIIGEENEPSCSYADSLLQQNLCINSEMAHKAYIMLYDLLYNRPLDMDYHGFYTNLTTGKSTRKRIANYGVKPKPKEVAIERIHAND